MTNTTHVASAATLTEAELFQHLLTSPTPESDLRNKVKFQVEERAYRISKARFDLFERSCLPRTSVLVRLAHPDRQAVFAHYRAKELRNVADAIRSGDDSAERRARKRLNRMKKLEAAFEDVDCEGYIVA